MLCMGTVIAIANQKGGVGKTTSTINIAAALAERGRRVLVVDLDPQGALTLALGYDPTKLEATVYDALVTTRSLQDVVLATRPDVHLAPSTIDLSGAEVELSSAIGREHVLRSKLDPLRDRYDMILIDCPPNLGLLTINALTAADGLLIPVQCQFLSFRGMQLLLTMVTTVQERTNPRLRVVGILPTLYDSRTAHGREVLGELRRAYADLLIDEPIRTRVALADASAHGKSIFETDGTSDVADAYRRVAEVIDGTQA